MTTTILQKEDKKELKPRITVIGVGGAGGNAVNNMIRGELQGVKFITSNTDAQALSLSLAEAKIQLGFQATQGLGAGSHPEVGKASAEESIEDVLSHIEGSNMLFVTAGMGGGTGTGAAPVIAKAAREKGILTIGVVTKPFHFEGSNRMRTAERGINELQQYVDTLIIIPNQNLFRVANEKTTFADAFKMADDVLYSGVRSITDLMMKPGLINLDFADVRAVMGGMMGKAMMGTGEAQGEGRAIEAAEAAISSPLLDDVSMPGAKAILINITGGLDMTLYEVDEAANRIREEVDPDAHIIFGSTFDESLQGRIRVSCVATGIDSHAATSLNKSRISDLEKEMQIAASLRAEQETSLESHLGNKEHAVFSAEMENPENIIKFTEFETPSPYSDERPQEDPYAYQTRPSKEEERPLGFFERLMGRKSQPTRPAQPVQRPRPQAMVSPELEKPLESEDESIEIPAFLRRQQNR
ncbi:MAG: cell division protein FtsZ [Alphaproteobacteria bacterium]|nr:cell division protein FtsZ [Alphaproteobacteria bacterium]